MFNPTLLQSLSFHFFCVMRIDVNNLKYKNRLWEQFQIQKFQTPNDNFNPYIRHLVTSVQDQATGVTAGETGNHKNLFQV